MRATLATLALTLAAPCASCHAQQRTIPFVGCPADGQMGPIAPPRGQPQVLPLSQVPAGAIAYYKGEQAPGVFAPAGWHCRVWYGSSGSMILVTPRPIDTTHFLPPKVTGPAVEMGIRFGGTSGRFAVASYGSRLFPTVLAKFIEHVKNEGLSPDSELSPHRFAADSVTSIASFVATFTTPPNVDGLGTSSFLGPSGDATRGVAVITQDPSEPDLSMLRVRLGGSMREIEAAVLRLNSQCMQQANGC
jgi:hypothetical protein